MMSVRIFTIIAAIGIAACDTGRILPPPSVDMPATDIDAAWSPDGQLLAFEHRQGVDPSDPEISGLYLSNNDGTDRRLLAEAGLNPSWSPDGRFLAFNRPDHQVYRLNLETGEEVQITSGDSWNHFPAWSPDGSTIAFESNLELSGGFYLHLMSADGSDIRRVVHDEDSPGIRGEQPTWAPDGRHIAYEETSRRTPSAPPEASIFVVDIADGQYERLARGTQPAWSPTGEWIAYIDEDSQVHGKHYLKLVSPDGSEQQVVFADGGPGQDRWPAGRPAWSPDGRSLVFTRPDRQGSGLWQIRIDGSELKQITHPSPNR